MSTPDLDLEFINNPVKMISIRRIPKIETPGLSTGEIEEGIEFYVFFWVAKELVELGLAKYGDDKIDAEEWTQIHYRERFQPIGRLANLPDRFYPRAFFTFVRERKNSKQDDSRPEKLDRLKGMFRDVIESRIGKISRHASTESSTVPKSLQPEESLLFTNLRETIFSWRKKMRFHEEN
jgi:hypothetical protein